MPFIYNNGYGGVAKSPVYRERANKMANKPLLPPRRTKVIVTDGEHKGEVGEFWGLQLDRWDDIVAIVNLSGKDARIDPDWLEIVEK